MSSKILESLLRITKAWPFKCLQRPIHNPSATFFFLIDLFLIDNLLFTQNSPLYVLTANIDKEIELQYRIHSALDIIDEKCSALSNKNPDQRDLFLGLLYATESYKMWACQTPRPISIPSNSAFCSHTRLQIRLHDEHENKVHPGGGFTELGIPWERDKNDLPKHPPRVRQFHLEPVHRAERTNLLQVCALNSNRWRIIAQIHFLFVSNRPCRTFDKNIRSKIDCYGAKWAQRNN